MRVAFLGYGRLGGPLTDHLQRLGHQVTRAAGDAGSDGVTKAVARNPNLEVEPPGVAVRAADVVFLATPFRANEAVLAGVADDLQGKILIDCTNPVGPGFTHGLGNTESGAERVQKLVPAARVVKAFSIYGFENVDDNAYPGYNVKPAMMFCGDDPDAKETAGRLIAQLGWDPVDVGGLDQALHLEHLTLLWVHMVRGNRASSGIVWAALRRG